ncbi:MAG: WYL domain-containing protein [Leptonema illini]|uniref:WYL domain-containing protein n=1 Tax=Leptonema illini TaxID=183 RepID=A0A833H0Y9_9LEPT|nr:MAG: WYL domain-containing protein [Leptonema illini]
MSTIEELQQIFRILPVLVQRRSMPIAELMELGGYAKKKDLIEDIEAMTMLGTPPYSPADLFDVEIRHDTVFLHSDPEIDRPLSLTPQEWSLLRSLIDADRAMTANGALPETERIRLMESLGAVPVHFIEAGPETEFRSRIEEALGGDRAVRLLYSNSDGPEEAERLVDPWFLNEYNRSKYLFGFDRGKGESRIFRLDRIVKLTVQKEARQNPAPDDLDAVRRARASEPDLTIRFRFPRSVLPALKREFAFYIEGEHNDTVTASVKTSSLEFFRWHLRAYAPFLEVIEPVELREWIVNEARRFPMPELLA